MHEKTAAKHRRFIINREILKLIHIGCACCYIKCKLFTQNKIIFGFVIMDLMYFECLRFLNMLYICEPAENLKKNI